MEVDSGAAAAVAAERAAAAAQQQEFLDYLQQAQAGDTPEMVQLMEKHGVKHELMADIFNN
eukprot:1285752-Pyramimonas_sp.AAC.1